MYNAQYNMVQYSKVQYDKVQYSIVKYSSVLTSTQKVNNVENKMSNYGNNFG